MVSTWPKELHPTHSCFHCIMYAHVTMDVSWNCGNLHVKAAPSKRRQHPQKLNVYCSFVVGLCQYSYIRSQATLQTSTLCYSVTCLPFARRLSYCDECLTGQVCGHVKFHWCRTGIQFSTIQLLNLNDFTEFWLKPSLTEIFLIYTFEYL